MAQLLYNNAIPDLQTLNQIQFDAAHRNYTDAVSRYEDTRFMALAALSSTMAAMTWLGLMLSTSIINPLKQVIAVFLRISNGQYDTDIRIEGKDEISKVMRALNDMQTKLGLAEEAIHQLAFHDPLTNLPNRRLLRDRLERALAASARNRMLGAVLMIDLDNFKRINDTRGHDIGDRLLADVAMRIQSNVRQADTVARLGGDEFSIVLVDLSEDSVQAAIQAENIGEKILRALNQPYVMDSQTYHSSASMGVCLFEGQDVGIDDLLKRADMSMYQAKGSGRNALRFYDPQIQASLENHTALESELREALPRNQLRLFYQIQVDNRHGVLGAEVLLRWEHPRHGLVPPDQFIPIAEESGLILPIGEWVLQTACAQLRAWASNPASEHFVLSVNVSARQFLQPDFVSLVTRTLAQTGVNPRNIKLELTESLVLHNVADTIEKMQALNQQGIHFSMDDFGTGYSSLAHLTELPIQQLKIDRSFVRHIASNYNDAIIIQTIIGMAHNLGVAVIAEGVETEAQRACLERFGCPTYQGYLFGKPMPLHEFEELALPVVIA
ncbi:MAG: EAL domain-containing protein [Burkholderiales bacterium]|nr:EAL domain-containing protein [Burkholderiales bacterium]